MAINNNTDLVDQSGFTAYGFFPKRLDQILIEMQSGYRKYLGDDIRTDEASVLGNIIAPESIEIASLWEKLEMASHTLDPRYATGIALDNLALLVGVKRHPAQKSKVDITLTGTNGTVVPRGTKFRDANFNYWELVSSYIIETNGVYIGAKAESSEFGEISASANTINQIIDPVVGLASVNNPDQAVLGRKRETDSELRQRIYENSTAKGVGSYNALLTGLGNIEGVSYVKIIENDTMTDTAPPNIVTAKSFMVVIAGGDTQEVGNAIWYHKPAGIATNGTTGVNVADLNGDLHNVNFQRPNNVDIYLDIELSPTEGVTWTGAYTASVKANIVAWANETLSVGNDVINSQIYTPINEVGGSTVNFLNQGKTANPTTNADIAINEVERAVFDESRINITVV